MNSKGAVTGMIVGISLMLFYMLKFKFGVFDGGKESVDALEADWWWGISPEGFGTVAMVANFAVALAVSALTPAPPEPIQELVEDIRTPEGAPPAGGH